MRPACLGPPIWSQQRPWIDWSHFRFWKYCCKLLLPIDSFHVFWIRSSARMRHVWVPRWVSSGKAHTAEYLCCSFCCNAKTPKHETCHRLSLAISCNATLPGVQHEQMHQIEEVQCSCFWPKPSTTISRSRANYQCHFCVSTRCRLIAIILNRW